MEIKTSDGTVVRDGDLVELALRDGVVGSDPTTGLSIVGPRSVRGRVRSFEQDGETRWEVVTDDHQHPAVGIVPGQFQIRR